MRRRRGIRGRRRRRGIREGRRSGRRRVIYEGFDVTDDVIALQNAIADAPPESESNVWPELRDAAENLTPEEFTGYMLEDFYNGDGLFGYTPAGQYDMRMETMDPIEQFGIRIYKGHLPDLDRNFHVGETIARAAREYGYAEDFSEFLYRYVG